MTYTPPDFKTEEGRAQLAKSVDYLIGEYASMSTEPDELDNQLRSTMAIFGPWEVVHLFVTALHHASGHKVHEAKAAEPRPHSITEAGQRALSDPVNEYGLDMMCIGYAETRIKETDQYRRMMASRKSFQQSPFEMDQLLDILIIALERLTDNAN